MDTSTLDPEHLFQIAKLNPDELERIRLREVEQLIARAPEHLKARLRGLQFQIDCKRRLHSTPLGSCIEISKMMLDSVHTLNEALHGRDTTHCSGNRRAATVLEFPTSPVINRSNIQQG
jgi:hypothetical protein